MLVILFCNLVCVYEYIGVMSSSLAFAIFFIVKSESKRLPATDFAAEDMQERKYSMDIRL